MRRQRTPDRRTAGLWVCLVHLQGAVKWPRSSQGPDSWWGWGWGCDAGVPPPAGPPWGGASPRGGPGRRSGLEAGCGMWLQAGGPLLPPEPSTHRSSPQPVTSITI